MENLDQKYTAIVKLYSEPLYWYIRRMVISHDDAQDILQETFISAYKHYWQLRNPGNIRSWLYKIATNEVKKHFRKMAGKMTTEEISKQLTESMTDSEYVDYSKAEGVILQKALLTLSKLEHIVFILKYYEEMDYEEIRKVTGSSIGSIKVSYHNAKEKIKKYMEL